MKTLYNTFVIKAVKSVSFALLLIIMISGCSANKARVRNYSYPENEKKEAIVQKEIKKRAKVTASTIEVFAKTRGVIRQGIGEVNMVFWLQETNGVKAFFNSYIIRILCTHDYFLKKSDEEREGSFFFETPLIVNPLQTKEVTLDRIRWVRKNINQMNRLLSNDEIDLELVLSGEDENGHKLKVKTRSGQI